MRQIIVILKAKKELKNTKGALALILNKKEAYKNLISKAIKKGRI